MAVRLVKAVRGENCTEVTGAEEGGKMGRKAVEVMATKSSWYLQMIDRYIFNRSLLVLVQVVRNENEAELRRRAFSV